MIITIIQSEIEDAVKDYVTSRIKLDKNQHFKIELLATRGSQGITANVEISDNEFDSAPERQNIDEPKIKSGLIGGIYTKSSSDPEQLVPAQPLKAKIEPDAVNPSSVFAQPEKKKNPFADLAN